MKTDIPSGETQKDKRKMLETVMAQIQIRELDFQEFLLTRVESTVNRGVFGSVPIFDGYDIVIKLRKNHK